MRRRYALLFLLLLLVPLWVLHSQEDSADFWEEQRDYYRQYSAWELPTETIIAWLNQLEKAENQLSEAVNLQNKVQSLSDGQQQNFDELQKSFDKQQSQLAGQRNLLIGGAIILVTIEVVRLITGR